MKNKLLITTALVALFSINNASATETIVEANVKNSAKTAYNNNSGDTLTVKDNIIFENNFSDVAGAGIYNNGTLNIGNGVQFISNTTYDHKIPASEHSEMGAAIYSQNASGKITIGNDVIFKDNKAGSGAIYLYQGNDVTIGDGVKFINNDFSKSFANPEATKTGALSIIGTDGRSNRVTIGDNAQFSGNNALYGSAIYIQHTGDSVTIGKNAVFDKNIGQAIYNGGTLQIDSGAIFSNNVGVVTATNWVANAGSAIFNGGTVTLNGAKIIQNTAGYGAGITNYGKMVINNSEFTDNASSILGGSIFNNSEIIFKGNNIFSNNKENGKLNDIDNRGTINVSGSLELDGGISGNGTTTFESGSTLTVNTGTTTIANTVRNEGATLNLKVDNGFTGKYQMVTGSLDNEFDIAENNLYKITADETKIGTYDIAKKSTSEVAAATGANANQTGAIAAVTSGESSNATFNAIANNINGMLQSSNKAEVQAGLDALTAIAPEAAPAVQSASTETTNQVFGAVGTRLSGGSVSTGGEGMASGDNIFERAAVWVQTLFNKSKLDDTSKSKGFDADTNGIAFGAEKFVNDDVKLGVGYAYSQTDIDGFMRSTDVDTHTAIVYGEYKPSNWYVNGIATYGWSDYSEKKNVAGVGVKADYDVETFGLQAMGGYDMNVKDVNVTPEAGLRYVHIKQDSYKDSADQKVSGNDSDILTGVIGAKVSKNWELSNGMNIKPEARVAATYDLMNDDVNSVVTLANGSAYAVEGKALDRFGMEFCAGVTAEVNDNVELSLGYEGKFRQDYQDHTGLLNAKYKF